jgi:hypothetical protein
MGGQALGENPGLLPGAIADCRSLRRGCSRPHATAAGGNLRREGPWCRSSTIGAAGGRTSRYDWSLHGGSPVRTVPQAPFPTTSRSGSLSESGGGGSVLGGTSRHALEYRSFVSGEDLWCHTCHEPAPVRGGGAACYITGVTRARRCLDSPTSSRASRPLDTATGNTAPRGTARCRFRERRREARASGPRSRTSTRSAGQTSCFARCRYANQSAVTDTADRGARQLSLRPPHRAARRFDVGAPHPCHTGHSCTHVRSGRLTPRARPREPFPARNEGRVYAKRSNLANKIVSTTCIR